MLNINFTSDNPLAFCLLRKNLAPRINQHAMSPGTATVVMLATLRGRQHVALVFNSAGAQQDFPVRATGGVGEGRGYDD